MVALQNPRLYTPDEYLERERKCEYKNEYLAGQIYAMSGGSLAHGAIAANILGEIHARLKGTPCQAYGSDVKVRTAPTGLFAYPDVSVVCGEPQYHDEHHDVYTNPILIVEVLSPSTASYDRGAKWAQYQTIASLHTYVLVAQNEPRIELFTRQPNGDWTSSVITGIDSSLPLASIDCTLALRDIYNRVTFPASPSLPSF